MSSGSSSGRRWSWRWPLALDRRSAPAVVAPPLTVNAHAARTTGRRLGDYSPYVPVETLSRLRRDAEPLAGLRVLHLSAGPFGSNTADMLAAIIPLQQDLGMRADWLVLRAQPQTEWLALYEGISGGLAAERVPDAGLIAAPRFNVARECAEHDVVIVHDPQLVPLVNLVPRTSTATWLWHCHLDLRVAQRNLSERLVRDLRRYSGVIAAERGYMSDGIGLTASVIADPIIDPCSARCKPLAPPTIRELLQRLGLDAARPIVAQFAPIGHRYASVAAVGAYWLARRSVPNLQLVLADVSVASPESHISNDDAVPSDRRQVVEAVRDDPDVHLFSAANGLTALEANALQSGTSIALQMAMPRGIAVGLLECQWKRKPSVVGRFGQLPEQVANGRAGAVTDGAPEAAEWIRHLLNHPSIAHEQGQRAHELAKQHLVSECLTGYVRLLRRLKTASVGADARADRSLRRVIRAASS